MSKIVAAGGGALATYDVCCNQFGWPKIPELWGMTGALLPIWAWIALAQFGLLYLLFEAVRRNVGQARLAPAQIAGPTQAEKAAEKEYYARQALAYQIDTVVNAARRAMADGRSERTAEKQLQKVNALCLTLHKEKGIPLPPKLNRRQLDLEAACRLLETIHPLIERGHYEEAKEEAQEFVDRLTPKPEASV